MKQDLEYRMYGFVPYNISDIQKGIQFGHAVQEYNNKYFARDNDDFTRWRTKDKTFIILNGGTTGKQTNLEDGLPHGTLNQHGLTLKDNDIKFASFYEPDLGNQLTAIVFLVDERVFNKERYPDFKDYIISKIGIREYKDNEQIYLENTNHNENPLPENIYPAQYQEWETKIIGGNQNSFLRKFLTKFKLA